jgi:hypothetical protein
MAGYFVGYQLHEIDNIACIYSAWAGINAFSTKPAPKNSFHQFRLHTPAGKNYQFTQAVFRIHRSGAC